MSFFQLVVSGLVALVAIYLAVRLGSAAYFKSKQQHEQTRKSS